MKVFAVLALCLAVAYAGTVPEFIAGKSSISPLGIVNHSRCGGVGTFRQARVEGCEGAICNVYPGRKINMEGDLIPAGVASSFMLTVDALLDGGLRVNVIKTTLINSCAENGQLCIISFSIVPNDTLSGQNVTIEANIHHASNSLHEICIQVQVHVV